jgi:Electron transfer DM13
MKKIIIALFALTCLVSACKKEQQPANDTPPITLLATDTVVYSGTFANGAHTTTGTARTIKSAGGKRFLILDNLQSDAGPDLRVFLATDRANSSGTEVSATVKNGNARIEIPAAVNGSTQKYVLIWCQQYSVLFGSAELK